MEFPNRGIGKTWQNFQCCKESSSLESIKTKKSFLVQRVLNEHCQQKKSKKAICNQKKSRKTGLKIPTFLYKTILWLQIKTKVPFGDITKNPHLNGI